MDWSQRQVREAFFARVPRPLAVMLACDVAALAPQTAAGAEAIDAARRWIMGAAGLYDVRVAARAAAASAHSTADPAYAAAAAAHTVHTTSAYLAYSAAAVCKAVCQCAAQRGLNLERVGYRAQWRRVEFLRHAMEEPHVRLLLTAHGDDSSVRPILWDAMLDAGYTPQTPRLE